MLTSSRAHSPKYPNEVTITLQNDEKTKNLGGRSTTNLRFESWEAQELFLVGDEVSLRSFERFAYARFFARISQWNL